MRNHDHDCAAHLARLKALRSRVEIEISLELAQVRTKARGPQRTPHEQRLYALPAADVRAWARATGHPVGESGKVALDIRRAYWNAHHPQKENP